MDVNGFSDPYFTISLMPHVESKHGNNHHKTKTHSKTLNPVINEAFDFPVQDPGQAVHIVAWDADLLNADDLIGEVFLPQPERGTSTGVQQHFLRRPVFLGRQLLISRLIKARGDAECKEFFKHRNAEL